MASPEHNLRILFDLHQFNLPPADEQHLRDGLGGLARQVENFPVADLHVLIEGNARSNDVSVKLTLILPGTTLVASDHDVIPEPAFERALNSLLESLHEYKDRLGQVSERQKTEKGTHQELHANVTISAAEIDTAVASEDYPKFRTATLAYEDGINKRIGRWVQRYPDLEARIGRDLRIEDVVEEVFLAAFENYTSRSPHVPFGRWLENLIDPAIKALQTRGEEELQTIRLAQSTRAALEPKGDSNASNRLQSDRVRRET